MELTKKQAEGLDIAIQRFRDGEKYTVISGYAGAGKSTLVKFITEALANEGIAPDLIGYACYTGKAAQVLIDKGIDNAVTLHKLLYKAILLPNGKYKYQPRDCLDYRVVIVDECSMAPASIIKQLASHEDVYCIFCGDPAQLPPILESEDNHLLDRPHIFLDEIMRQAQDSGIIRLSMLIREGKSIKGFTSNDAKVISSSCLEDTTILNSDINLCATNNTRKDLNAYIRQLKGLQGPYPLPGDKVICLRNEWDTCSERGNALTNGCIGTLDDIYNSCLEYPYWRYKPGVVDTLNGHFVTETGDDFGELFTDKELYRTGKATISDKEKYNILKNKGAFQFRLPLEFDFAYAITVWKAQGSQWNNVVLLEENFPRERELHTRFLYTAVTRAVKNIEVYLKN